eukprot:TRINITY_DN4462_c0_g1_i16.p1 TRINITY_DN4462_c0_g1~~TRINITY_DN4462_c0_g1_i16.p1  ORF type:complete len:3841 (+),score=673.31 TRINITY_DN4462_c0_g1_i16:59-11581(+)
MLEGLVRDVLLRFFGNYVKQFDHDQLSVSLWGGDATLHNVELKEEALSSFTDFPFYVKKGCLCALRVVVPWKNLGTQPVVIHVDGLYVLAEATHSASHGCTDPVLYAQQLLRQKLQKIALSELIGGKSSQVLTPVQAPSDSFSQRLLTKVLDNIQVKFSNIHFRYEDSNIKGKKWALGITLKSINTESTDQDWKSCFITPDKKGDRSYKLVQMDSLSVYWDSNVTPVTTEADLQTFSNQMTALIAPCEHFRHTFILEPISGTLKLTIREMLQAAAEVSKEEAKYSAEIAFNRIAFFLNREQYCNFLEVLTTFHTFKNNTGRMNRPQESVMADPKAWLQYACGCVVSDVRERRRRRTWAYIKERRDDRRCYTACYANFLQNKASNEDLSQLDELETKLTYEDIIFFRSLSIVQLKRAKMYSENLAKEQQQLRQQQQQQELLQHVQVQPAANAPQASGWLGRFGWGWWGPSGTETEPALAEGIEHQSPAATPTPEEGLFAALSQEQRDELLALLGVGEEAPPLASAEGVQARVQFRLDSVSLVLREGADTSTCSDLLELKSWDARADWRRTYARHSSIDAALGGVVVTDLQTSSATETASASGPLFPYLVSLRNETSLPQQPEAGQQKDTFWVHLESHPKSNMDADFGDVDFGLQLRLLPLEVVFSPAAIKRVKKFFHVPQHIVMGGVSGDVNSWLSQGASAQWRDAIDRHLTIDIDAQLHAPLLVIPQSSEPGHPFLLVDLGRLDIKSDLRPRNAPATLAELQRVCYDHYTLILSQLHAQLLFNTEGDWRKRLTTHKRFQEEEGNSDCWSLVRPFAITLQLSKRILPPTPEHAGMEIRGELPQLHLQLSDVALSEMRRIVSLQAKDLFGGVDSIPAAEVDAATVELVQVDDDDEPDDVLSTVGEFTVGSLRTTLCVCSVEDAGKRTYRPLVDATAIRVQAGFCISRGKQQATLGLRSLRVRDEWSVEVGKRLGERYLAESPEEEDLFSVHITAEMGNKPRQLALAAGNLAVNLTLPTMEHLFRLLLGPAKPTEKPRWEEPRDASFDEEQLRDEEREREWKREGPHKWDLQVKLGGLTLTLDENAGSGAVPCVLPMARFLVTGLELQANVHESVVTAEGTLGSLVVLDLTAPPLQSGAGSYAEVFRSIQREDEKKQESVHQMIRFTLRKHLGVCSDSFLYVSMRTIRLVYLSRFISRLFTFITAYGEMTHVAQHSDTDGPDNRIHSRFLVKVEAQHPLIVVPRNSTSRSCFVADLNDVTAQNSFHDKVDDLLTTMKHVKFFSCHDYPTVMLFPVADAASAPGATPGGSPRVFPIADDVDMAVHFVRPRWWSVGSVPVQEIAIFLEDIKSAFDSTQYDLITGILTENFSENTTPAEALLRPPTESALLVWRKVTVAVPEWKIRFRQEEDGPHFVLLVARGFSMKFEQRDLVRTVDTALHGIAICDLLKPGAPETLLTDQDSLVPYQSPCKTQQTPSEKDLLCIQYARDYEVSVSGSKYLLQLKQQQTRVAFNHLCINLHSVPFVGLYKFFTELDSQQPHLRTDQPPTEKAASSHTFEISLRHLVVVLSALGQKFATAEIFGLTTTVHHDAASDRTLTRGKLFDMNVLELATGTPMLSFSSQQDELIQFDVSIDPSLSRVWARVRDPTLTFSPSFFSQMGAYATELSLARSYLFSGAHQVITTVTAPPALECDVEIRGPHIWFPAAGASEEQAHLGGGYQRTLEANLGTLIVVHHAGSTNCHSRALDASLRCVSLRAHTGAAAQKVVAPRTLLGGVDVDLSIEQVPAVDMRASVKAVAASITKAELMLVRDVLRHMSAAKGTPVRPSLDYSAVVSRRQFEQREAEERLRAIQARPPRPFHGQLLLEQFCLELVDVASFTASRLSVSCDWVPVADTTSLLAVAAAAAAAELTPTPTAGLAVTVLLESLTVSDLLPHSANIYRDVVRGVPGSSANHLFYVQYTMRPKQKPQGCTPGEESITEHSVRVELSDLHFFVIPPVLVALSKFFETVKEKTVSAAITSVEALQPQPPQHKVLARGIAQRGTCSATKAMSDNIQDGWVMVEGTSERAGARRAVTPPNSVAMAAAPKVAAHGVARERENAATMHAGHRSQSVAPVVATPQLPPPKLSYAVNVEIHIAEPECIAVEDAGSVSSNAAVLRFKKLWVGVQMDADHCFEISAALDGAELFSCLLHQRATTQIPIVKPCDLTAVFQGCSVPGPRQCIAKVHFTGVSSEVSYNDLRLTLLLASQFVACTRTEASTPIGAEPLKWKHVDHTVRRILTQPPDVTLAHAAALATDAATAKKVDAFFEEGIVHALLSRSEWRLVLPQVNLTLVNDRSGLRVPVVQACVSNLTVDSSVDFSLTSVHSEVECKSFNDRISMWEPFLDPCTLRISLAYCPHAILNLNIDTAVELTLTTSLATSLCNVCSTWMSDFKNIYLTNSKGVATRKIFKPYQLVNNTGHPLHYSTPSSPLSTVAAYTSEDVDLKLVREEMQMRFEVYGCIPTPWIKVYQVHTLAFPIAEVPHGTRTTTLLGLAPSATSVLRTVASASGFTAGRVALPTAYAPVAQSSVHTETAPLATATAALRNVQQLSQSYSVAPVRNLNTACACNITQPAALVQRGHSSGGQLVTAAKVPATLQGPPCVVVDVRQGSGTKVIEVQSRVQVRNAGAHTLEIAFVRIGETRAAHVLQLLPGEISSVPLLLTASLCCHMFLRPHGLSYCWSRALAWDCLPSGTCVRASCAPNNARAEASEIEIATLHTAGLGSAKEDGSVDRSLLVQYCVFIDEHGKIPRSLAVPQSVKSVRYLLTVSSPLHLTNDLPYAVRYRLIDNTTRLVLTGTCDPGQTAHAHDLDLSHEIRLQIQIIKYSCVDCWSEEATVRTNTVASDGTLMRPSTNCSTHLCFHEGRTPMAQQTRPTLLLAVPLRYASVKGLVWRIYFKCPHWVNNRTALPLQLQYASGYLPPGSPALFVPPLPQRQGAPTPRAPVLRVAEYGWGAQGMPTHVGAAAGVLCLPGPSGAESFEIAVSVSLPPVTKPGNNGTCETVVNLAPRYVLVNACDEALYFAIPKTNVRGSVLKARQTCPLYLPQHKTILIKIGDYDYSQPISVAEVDDFCVRLRQPTGAAGGRTLTDVCVIGIEISIREGAELVVTVSPDMWGGAPYVVENWASCPIFIHQQGAEVCAAKLPALHSCPFAWDAPALPRLLCISGQPVKISKLNKQKTLYLPESTVGPANTVIVQVVVRGLSRVVKVVDCERRKSLGDGQTDPHRSSSIQENYSLQLELSVPSIGISLVDSTELLFLYFELLQLQHCRGNLRHSFVATIHYMQFDCQLHHAFHQVMLYPTPIPDSVRTSTGSDSTKPFLHVSAVRSQHPDANVLDHFPIFNVLIQEMELQIEETTVERLLAVYKLLAEEWGKHFATQQRQQNGLLIPSSLESDVVPKQQRRVYAELLMLNPIIINCTFATTAKLEADSAVAGEEGNQQPTSSLISALHFMGSIDRVPLQFPALFEKDYCATWENAVSRVCKHYSDAAVYQVLRFAGNLEVLGNPVTFYHNMKQGVSDLLYQPYQGVMILSPRQIGAGLGKGTKSLAKHSIYALFNSASGFTSSVGSAISSLSRDDRYLAERHRNMLTQPGNLGEGITKGGRALASSFASGLYNVVAQPARGAERDGAAGLIDGAIGGFVGLFAKPAAGVFDLIASTAQGIKSEASSFDRLNRRRRPPREITPDGAVVPYNPRRSLGQSLLFASRAPDEAADFYVDHVACRIELPEGQMVEALIVSTAHLCYVTQLWADPPKLRWQLKLRMRISIRAEVSKICVTAGARTYVVDWDKTCVQADAFTLTSLLPQFAT